MKLGVNIDHVATLREARRIDEPDPVEAALIAETAGANSIVAHLREDRRHMKEKDIRSLKEAIKTRLNLEMSINKEIVEIAKDIKPEQSTLVPEKRQEITTEGGLDVISNFKDVKKVVDDLKSSGIIVSLFIDPNPEQIKTAGKLNVDIIELHTGEYANSKDEEEEKFHLERLVYGAKLAADRGFVVCAGHGLNYKNVRRITMIPQIEELNIGHSIISRAVFTGLENAVKEMKELINI